MKNGKVRGIDALRNIMALAALLHALPGVAASCEDLRTEVESKIRRTGVAQFTVSIVATDASAPGRVVGTCDRGSKKLLYLQANTLAAGEKTQQETSSAVNRPAKKNEPILTECKDGSVSMNSDCKK